MLPLGWPDLPNLSLELFVICETLERG